MSDRNIVKNANARMQLLRKVASFGNPVLFVRSIHEQSMTEENTSDLKLSINLILEKQFKGFEKGLAQLGLQTLKSRREQLSLNFASKCVNNKKLQHMFPMNSKSHDMKTSNISCATC